MSKTVVAEAQGRVFWIASKTLNSKNPSLTLSDGFLEQPLPNVSFNTILISVAYVGHDKRAGKITEVGFWALDSNLVRDIASGPRFQN